MAKNNNWSPTEVAAALLAMAFTFFINGAVPFLMMPTLGQAVWSMGFAQSFANGSLFDFYAHDFGIPKPAAIAFGLAGAWPASLLIRLGLHPADAYASMVMLWLGLAFFSAYQIARLFGATRHVSLLGATAWLSMPMVWGHSGYSMLSLGIALLSFYFFVTLRLFLLGREKNHPRKIYIFFYGAATLIAIFMDGYTFMMFATGSTILLIYSIITRPQVRLALVKIVAPVHITSFALSYFMYSLYIGAASFTPSPIDAFRGWGLDLSFIATPSAGVLWIPDLLGISLGRSDVFYFGDASVWNTTFALPILLIGATAWWQSRCKTQISNGIFIVAIFGFFMALGPSLKINSTKPESLRLSHPRQASVLMPKELAIAPTGNAWISEKIPGFNSMRASYRWLALSIFGMWVLVIAWTAHGDNRRKWIWHMGLPLMILVDMPNLKTIWLAGTSHRYSFEKIDRELVSELRNHLKEGETVGFIPWGNDFFANYLTPKIGVRSFNIGGDKNLASAQPQWPKEMLELRGKLDVAKAQIAVGMLSNKTVDAIIVPYFDMLWSAHQWPCAGLSQIKLNEQGVDHGNNCISEAREEYAPLLLSLRQFDNIKVDQANFFAVVRLRNPSHN